MSLENRYYYQSPISRGLSSRLAWVGSSGKRGHPSYFAHQVVHQGKSVSPRDNQRSFVGPSRLFIVVVVLTMLVVVSIVVMVRVVVVLNAARISFPVTRVVPFAVMVRANPASPFVGWSSPVAFVPLIMVSHGIPIALYPHELRSWPFWHDHSHSDWRWLGNHDSNRYLRVDYRARG